MNGIVLLSKQPGITSFKSLNNVKKALNTTKVGHTGTLDSFAQGLLVVCVGRYTRLAGNITEFDKAYRAVIKFGEETDTLEYTGQIVKSAPLPDVEAVKAAVKKFTGEQLQTPPLFSAIHIAGKRASEMAVKGQTVDIPPRKVTVYSARIQDILCNEENKVIACLVDFNVSKGTYIRSLARDIGNSCNSAAHLAGLYRTRVGNFNVEDSAGFSLLKAFSLKNCLEQVEQYKLKELEKKTDDKEKILKYSEQKNPDGETFDSEEITSSPEKIQINERKVYIPTEEDLLIKEEIKKKIKEVDEKTAETCGFKILHLKNTTAKNLFMNGQPLKKNMFVEDLDGIYEREVDEQNCSIAVFYEENFGGLLGLNGKKLIYKFVNN